MASSFSSENSLIDVSFIRERERERERGRERKKEREEGADMESCDFIKVDSEF